MTSVFVQTELPSQVIYVDDGSTDDSVGIARSFEDKGLIVALNEGPKGIPYSRNKALSLCQRDWVAVLDADDIWRPDKLAKQVSYLGSHPNVGLIGSFATILFGSQELGEIAAPCDNRKIKEQEIFRNCFVHSSVIFRKELADKVGGYSDFAAAQDYDLMLKIGETTEVANLPEALVVHRISSTTISVARRGVQNHYARLAQKNAIQRRGIRFDIVLKTKIALHRTYQKIVSFDPAIHWGVHQLLAGDCVQGRALLKDGQRRSFKGRIIASIFRMIPDAVYRSAVRWIS